MNITYIISDINKAVYFEDTALALRSKGLTVSFILINAKGGDLDLFLTEHQFKVKYIRCKKVSKSFSPIKKCLSLLKELKPELIHCHLAMANWIGLWAGKFAGIKTRVYTRHSGEPLHIHWKERLIDKIQNGLSTKVIAITKVIEDLLLQQGVKRNKVALIHHGFMLNSFSEVSELDKEGIKKKYNITTEQQPIIGVVARWMEWKGVHFIIDAYKKLRVDYPNSKLFLFGASEEGDFSKDIFDALKELPDHSVEVVKYEKNVHAMYTLFDIYTHVPVNNSCEAFGQTYVEALAAGVPSIFTLSGIANEFIIDNENALVVPYKDSDAIYKAAKKLIEGKELQEKLKESGLISVKQFNFDNYINKLIKIYE
ncbi:MAG: glycosyltransferase family 4 protein [Fluviicola sp.]|nr:glycosyltransferase family 4 protein [Fluviicola sp.]